MDYSLIGTGTTVVKPFKLAWTGNHRVIASQAKGKSFKKRDLRVQKMTKFSMKQGGFTLVELLVVIAIVAALSAMLFPVLANAKESAKRTAALSQVKQLGAALKMYIDNYDDKFLPSTNYGIPESSPSIMWQNGLLGLVKDKGIFVAPDSDAQFADTWEERGQMSIGYNSATAIDTQYGCPDDQADTDGCIAFRTAASAISNENLAKSALFAITANGRTEDKYRGYEFSPYNGTANSTNAKFSPPLTSDRDLVKEMATLPPRALKPLYCRYMRTGSDDGYTPVAFADGHVKDYSANEIMGGQTGILWRFR